MDLQFVKTHEAKLGAAGFIYLCFESVLLRRTKWAEFLDGISIEWAFLFVPVQQRRDSLKIIIIIDLQRGLEKAALPAGRSALIQIPMRVYQACRAGASGGSSACVLVASASRTLLARDLGSDSHPFYEQRMIIQYRAN